LCALAGLSLSPHFGPHIFIRITLLMMPSSRQRFLPTYLNGGERMASIFEDRRQYSNDRLNEIRTKLADAEQLISGKACVYVTGSFGRGEASARSDLDLFIVGCNQQSCNQQKGDRCLSRLDEICLEADLIKASQELQFPQFSGDGEYLIHHTETELTKELGRPSDDAKNTFTARMLLLLESQPLLGTEIYKKVIKKVIDAYWKDYQLHSAAFVPAFLANDILRMWRTFCVNYEARTRSEPEREKGKRRLKNYKLKHSRLLTCYSALAFFLGIHEKNKTVSPDDARQMAQLKPIERFEWLKQTYPGKAAEKIDKLFDAYGCFLETTGKDEEILIGEFLDEQKRKAFKASANSFGNLVFEILSALGQDNALFRLLVV
jgi:predicted nucleotidyltransferase